MRRALRPLRRFVAWFALVREEESDRKRHVDLRIADLERRLERAQHESAGRYEEVRRSLAEFRAIMDDGVGARADATLSQLWRRMEGADARQATAIQRLAEEVERLREEQEATNELLERLGIFQTPAPREDRDPPLGEAIEVFRNRAPIVDLACGKGEFLKAARAVGLEAYGIQSDPEAVEAGRTLGLDIRLEDPLAHLRGIESDTLGGVFCADGIGRHSDEEVAELLGEVARALRPGGVVVITPRSESRAAGGSAALSRFARRAGLVVDEATCAGDQSPRARLALVARKPA